MIHLTVEEEREAHLFSFFLAISCCPEKNAQNHDSGIVLLCVACSWQVARDCFKMPEKHHWGEHWLGRQTPLMRMRPTTMESHCQCRMAMMGPQW
jgi:hypothetical protein